MKATINWHSTTCKKIDCSIDDINHELSHFERDNKSIVFIVSCVDWIRCSCYLFTKECLNNEILDGFKYSKESKLNVFYEYYEAIRSFVVAHPLNTDRHKKFGLCGDIKCVDIVSANNPLVRLLRGKPNGQNLNILLLLE